MSTKTEPNPVKTQSNLMLRLVWTDPRSGHEYLIVCSERLSRDGEWLSSHFRVRNLNTREEAGLQHKDLNSVQAALMGLVDSAEDLIRQRSQPRRTRSLWLAGRGFIHAVISRARRWPSGNGR